MIMDIIHNQGYKNLVENQVYEVIDFLLSNTDEFSITANINSVSFNPPMPQTISQHFGHFTMFTLANYTFESAELDEKYIQFEAGFGAENFGSVVTIPLEGIFQIILGESILFLNPIATIDENFDKDNIEQDEELSAEDRSMNAFMKNNKNLFK